MPEKGFAGQPQENGAVFPNGPEHAQVFEFTVGFTQDVMEHVFHPERVFKEIARTLKPGGAHIFTVPLVNKNKPSKRRAEISKDSQIIHHEPTVYHGNPISEEGSLVTMDWGNDICARIFGASGLFTHIVLIDDISKGIRAEYLEVLVTLKPGVSETENALR